MRIVLTTLALVLACSTTSPPASTGGTPQQESKPDAKPQESKPQESKPTVTPPSDTDCTATDGRISISARIDPTAHFDRIPMRRARMVVKNVSKDPVRLLRIRPEAFRYATSTLVIAAPGADAIWSPEPRPHGYLIDEGDFVLIEPGAQTEVEQSFTIDPMVRGSGTNTAREPGFTKGTLATVTWTLENSSTSFPGGANTLDGVTKPLFGGRELPELWTGKLACRLQWTIPD